MALESALIPLFILLTCEKYKIPEIRRNIAQNTELLHEMRQTTRYFIIQKHITMFTCLFEEATSNIEERNYNKTR